jgi:hypothetical protein
MIVNETAKFENVRIPRRSSCAYPRLWSWSRSRELVSGPVDWVAIGHVLQRTIR